MPRRHQRHSELLDGQKQHVIEALRRCWAAMSEAQRGLKPGSPTYALAGGVMAAIDRFAEFLTGDPECFWSGSHSTSDRDSSKRRE